MMSMALANITIGYKFESLCLIPDTWNSTSRDFIETREDHTVSNHAQYCSGKFASPPS